jgi:hypothetical protein
VGVQDVMGMKKRKKVKLLLVQDAENIKLHWKIRRQVQQEILQKKLMQCFLSPNEGNTCIKLYPEAMQPMIRDFMRRADMQTRL